MTKLSRLLVLLSMTLGILLIAVGVFLHFERAKRATQEADIVRNSEEAVQQKRDIVRQARALVESPPPPSPWLEARKKTFTNAVIKGKPVAIIVPPTVPEGAKGVDVTGRITMARRLARLVAGEFAALPDPGLVFLALGEPRHLKPEQIRALALQLAAEVIVTGTAVHDGAGKMTVTFTKTPQKSTQGFVKVEETGIEIGETVPPELAFNRVAETIAKGLGFKVTRPEPAPKAGPDPLVLPQSPDALANGPGGHTGIWAQQLFACLFPLVEGVSLRPKERMLERTLAAVLELDPRSPDYTVMLARALAHLDRRPAALKVLASGKGGPEEEALAAYLNGDLPRLKKAVALVKRPIPRLISELELLLLRAWFGDLPDSERRALVRKPDRLAPAQWHPLLAYYVLAFDLWDLPSPVTVKQLLDHSLPVEAYRVEDIVRGKAALGASPLDEKTYTELLVAPLVHATKWREINAAELCCAPRFLDFSRPARSIHLDLLESVADNLIIGQLEFLRYIQGRPEQMASLADALDQRLFAGGHPTILTQRMSAHLEQMGRQGASKRDPRLTAGVFESARKVLAWEPVQGELTGIALRARDQEWRPYLSSQGVRVHLKNIAPDPGSFDYPPRWRWADIVKEGLRSPVLALAGPHLVLARDACIGTTGRFTACSDYIEALQRVGSPELEQARKEHLESRFLGNTSRTHYLVKAKSEAGDHEGAKALLREAVRTGSTNSSIYSSLGDFLRREGEFREAAKVYLSYPALSNPDENRVGLSNYLGRAGYELLLAGGADEARPLLERAARNNDGSSRSLWSAAQVLMQDGNYDGTLRGMQDIYQRYRQPPMVRQIASLLFALGEPEQAWGALRQGIPISANFSPYRAAAVGLRSTRADTQAITAWANEALTYSGHYLAGDFVSNAVFQAMAIDRAAKSIRAFYEVDDGLVSPNPRMPWPSLRKAEGKAVSELAMLIRKTYVEAYSAFKAGDHAQAAERWEELVRYNEKMGIPPNDSGTHDAYWGGMPYYAYSLCKLGRIDAARALPGRWITGGFLWKDGKVVMKDGKKVPARKTEAPDHEKNLVLAVVEAFSGNHKGAEALIRQARGTMSEPGTRLIPPEYAFVEILEALTMETKHPTYLQTALSYARAFQRYEPWAAWAYAFEAKHATNDAQRVRAAALALKLDPGSERLSGLDAKTLDGAQAWLEQRKPLSLKKPARLSES